MREQIACSDTALLFIQAERRKPCALYPLQDIPVSLCLFTGEENGFSAGYGICNNIGNRLCLPASRCSGEYEACVLHGSLHRILLVAVSPERKINVFGANGCFIDVGPAHALGQSPQNVVLLQHLRRSERSALEITGKIKYSEERLFHYGPAFAAFYRVPEKLADLFYINAVIIPRQRKQTFDMKKIFILHFLQ